MQRPLTIAFPVHHHAPDPHKDAAQSCRLEKLLHAVQGWYRSCHCRHGTSNTLNMQGILYACHDVAHGLTG